MSDSIARSVLRSAALARAAACRATITSMARRVSAISSASESVIARTRAPRLLLAHDKAFLVEHGERGADMRAVDAVLPGEVGLDRAARSA